MRIVALVPAHNEGEQITATIESLLAQSRRPDQTIVLADNCTDDTAERALAAGASVVSTIGNGAKKAGALNQGLRLALPLLSDEDMLLLADADSVLCADWVEKAAGHLEESPWLGAVSGAYVARRGRGLVSLLQRAEYAQERRRISRRGGRVDVLSGTAVMLPARVARELIEERGYVYDEKSLTEDFEMTLAVQTLGYSPRCFRELSVVTDVMETWPDLARQRLRWQRGTIETLRGYGWSRLTRRLWVTQVLTYGSTGVTVLIVSAWTLWALNGGQVNLWWLAVVPLFMLEQAVSSHRAGAGPAAVAAALVPMWLYDLFRVGVYWVALAKSVGRAPATWA